MVNEKVSDLVTEIVQFVEFNERHATPFTFGLKHRWTYFLRTLPDIQDLLEPLENAIFLVLIYTFASQCPNMVK